METSLYRKVIAVMISIYLMVTFAVQWGGVTGIQPQLAVAIGVVLVLLGAVVLNFILKSAAATISLIVLLAFVSFVSALVLAILLAVIGSLMRLAPMRESLMVDNQGNRAWSSDFVAIDPRTNLPIGHIGSDPFEHLR